MSYTVMNEEIPATCEECYIRDGDVCPYLKEAHLLPFSKRHDACPLVAEGDLGRVLAKA